MPSLRPVVALSAVLLLLPGCHAQPEARYSAGLGPCELLPRPAAVRATDVGAKIGPAQAKESHVLIPYKYCEWAYKQDRKHFWSAYRRGPVERRVTIELQVVSAKKGGAPAAGTRFDGDREDDRKNGAAITPVTGIGESAFQTVFTAEGASTGVLEFRRSNAVVTVKLTATDCCRGTSEYEVPSGTRTRLLMTAATAADQTLLTR
ncbi:hypothetical protein AB0E69_13980 [Kribbella sp. NPDC026611]|uniref:hypothetical protein n=1 Tax=Kribbella sp. NPDC026611 TaxID=3154911 RepID=UPI0034119CF8